MLHIYIYNNSNNNINISITFFCSVQCLLNVAKAADRRNIPCSHLQNSCCSQVEFL